MRRSHELSVLQDVRQRNNADAGQSIAEIFVGLQSKHRL